LIQFPGDSQLWGRDNRKLDASQGEFRREKAKGKRGRKDEDCCPFDSAALRAKRREFKFQICWICFNFSVG
jgi:hypothetical protein